MSEDEKSILYNTMLKKYEEMILIDEIAGILRWDQNVMLPKKSVQKRAKQLGFMSALEHKYQTDPEFIKIINTLNNHPDFNKFSDVEKRSIKLVKKDIDWLINLPEEFVKHYEEHLALAKEKWKEAKVNKDFSIYKPYLEKVIDLVKQKANYVDPDKDPFDVMIDYFEPGLSSKVYDRIFNQLKEFLVPFIQKCVTSPNQPDLSIIKKQCPKKTQRKLEDKVISLVGYDIEAGRLDESPHPFTAGGYDDVRITTNYDENEFTKSFFAVLHEAGHGIYDQNYPTNFRYQPIGKKGASSGIHESQSRFYENFIGRSLEFWEYFFPYLKEVTGDLFADVDLNDFYRAVNQVKTSKIRIYADEVTYTLHIILRFEIERDFFAGKIQVDDLPKIWNNKIKDYFNLNIENDAEGVLQDIHWSWGYLGQFPCYSMGNIYGAQILHTLSNDLPQWKDLIREGKIIELTKWLNKNVHQKGRLYDPLELVKEISGEELNPQYYIDYLKEKYTKIYSI
jgi:carboxypeptidase Taq